MGFCKWYKKVIWLPSYSSFIFSISAEISWKVLWYFVVHNIVHKDQEKIYIQIRDFQQFMPDKKGVSMCQFRTCCGRQERSSSLLRIFSSIWSLGDTLWAHGEVSLGSCESVIYSVVSQLLSSWMDDDFWLPVNPAKLPYDKWWRLSALRLSGWGNIHK